MERVNLPSVDACWRARLSPLARQHVTEHHSATQRTDEELQQLIPERTRDDVALAQ